MRLRYITEEALGARIDAAKKHVWKLLAERERPEILNFSIGHNGNTQHVVPNDLVLVAEVTQFVQEIAQLMADFSVFPYPPEA